MSIPTLNLTEPVPLSGSTLIEASAGTGKTFSIAKIFLQAILNGTSDNIPIEKILVVTFTEAATQELRLRIRDELSTALALCKGEPCEADDCLKHIVNKTITIPKAQKVTRLEMALLNIDQAAIFTIHGFCQRMLSENAFESGQSYGLELLTDDSKIVAEAVEIFWRRHLLDVPAQEQELWLNIKYDYVLALAREVMRYQHLRFVNDNLPEYTPPPKNHKLLREYQEVNNELTNWLDKIAAGPLKAELIAKFEQLPLKARKKNYADNLHKNFDRSIEALHGGKVTKITTFLAQSEIDEQTLTANAQKQGIKPPQHPFFAFCQRYYEICKAKKSFDAEVNLVQKENNRYITMQLKTALIKELDQLLTTIKTERAILTFDDLICNLYQALSAEKNADHQPLTNLIRQKFQLALVDEFQDTDAMQYEIFAMLFGSSNQHGFFMIGDPKQSIYRFRGADIFSYLTAKQNVDRQYTLSHNYRSEANMLNAINELFTLRQQDMFVYAKSATNEGIVYRHIAAGADKPKLVINEHPDSKPLHIWLTQDGESRKFLEYDISKRIAGEIIRLLDEQQARFENSQPLTTGDIAILVNTNAQATLLKKSLTDSKIPAVIQNSVRIFETWEAREMQLWLKAVMEPIERNIRPLLITNLLKHSLTEINQLNDQQMMQFAEQFTVMNKMWQHHGMFVVFNYFLRQYQVKQQLLTLVNGERVITNYLQLAELIHQEERKSGISIEMSLAYLEHQIDQPDANDEYLQRLESDRDAVKIMTIHKAKGLEFPVVFCPFLWASSCSAPQGQQLVLFSEEHNGSYQRQVDCGSEADIQQRHLMLSQQENLAEHIRLLYVAVTRAVSRCYLIVGNCQQLGKSALAYIFNPDITPEEFVSRLQGRGSNQQIAVLQRQCSSAIQQFAMTAKYASLEKLPPPPDALLKEPKNDESNLQARHFPLEYINSWGIGNFSNLIKGQPYHAEPSIAGTGFAALPKGKKFGNAIHAILQNYFTEGDEHFYNHLDRYLVLPLQVEADFRSPTNSILQEKLSLVEAMLNNLLTTPLRGADTEDLQLKAITPADAKAELPFLYRLNSISPTILQNIFQQYAVGIAHNFVDELENLNFSLRYGYMNGEIDLLFRYNNRYYIADWKTNHLGPDSSCYSPAAIAENMRKHFYVLQYHIYTLAAHLFLQQRCRDYDYQRDFGGVFYLYLRGVDKSGNGIFYDKPAPELINALTKALI